VGELQRLELEVRRIAAAHAELEAEVRTLQTEQLAMHKQVRQWMRRAVAAERAVERRQVGTPSGAAVDRAAVALPDRPVNLRGARGRIYVRHLEELAAEAARRSAGLRDAPEPNGADLTESEGDDGLPA